MGVQGFAYVSLPYQQKKETLDFYQNILEFKIVSNEIVNIQKTSEDDVWLHNYDSGITIKLFKAQSASISEVVFSSNSIESFQSNLDLNEIIYEKFEDKEFHQIFLRFYDPSGNSITISNVQSPFSSNVLPDQTKDQVQIEDKWHDSQTENIKKEKVESPRKSTKKIKIGVVTSGGDSQGMNAAFRAIIRTGIYKGCQVFAIHEGYKGLVEGGDYIKECQWRDGSGIISKGGTIIGTARCKEMRTREGRLKAAYNLVTLGISNLVVMGGDGSLTGANLFREEWKGLVDELAQKGQISNELAAEHPELKIVGMVGSIDNDMWGTDLTIGANSALHRIVEAIDSLSSTAESHQRCFVIEVMGRNCGWLALMAGLATEADWVFIPESPFDTEEESWETILCRNLTIQKVMGKRSLMILIAEGAIDSKGNSIKSETVRQVLADKLNLESRVTVLGHVQRGGTASSFDRYLGTTQGAEAVSALLELTPGTPSVLIGINENNITRFNLMECVRNTLAVGKAIENRDFNEAMRLRGPDYKEAYQTFLTSCTRFSLNEPERKPSQVSLRIAIVHTGAPAAGMNIATKVAVRIGLDGGHVMLGVYGGFEGLIFGDVKEMDWQSVSHWANTGGSFLRTNRSLPSQDFGLTAFNLQKFNVHALLVIGGFEAYTSISQLLQARDRYPQFCIPIVHIPATISNNVPGTEYSLGSDTALNTIIQSCDLLKMSATSSSKRAFVVEVMGGKCGYLATLAGLGAGASKVYIPEKGITLDDLKDDIKGLAKKFSRDKNEGRIILRNEEASKTYTTEFISALLNEEGTKMGLFDCRSANLGHLQQGGAPSPLDRIRAARYAVKSMNFLLTTALKSQARSKSSLAQKNDQLTIYCNTPESACVIGTNGRQIVLTPVASLSSQTNFEKRRPKNQWWLSLVPLSELLSQQVSDEEEKKL